MKVIKLRPFTFKRPQYIGDKIQVIYRRADDKKDYRHRFSASTVAIYDDGHIIILDNAKKIKFSEIKGIH